GWSVGLNPPAPDAELASSVVVGVSNEDPMLAYTVTMRHGFAAMPNDPEKARMRRSPESSGLFAVIRRSCTANFSQSYRTPAVIVVFDDNSSALCTNGPNSVTCSSWSSERVVSAFAESPGELR